MTKIRYDNGEMADVLNYRIGNIPTLSVYVGYDPMFPKVLQVLGPRFSFANLGAIVKYMIQSHHRNHEWPGWDTVWIRGQQILPLLVSPSKTAPFSVTIYEGWLATTTGFVHVPEQDVDLSGDQPTAGALMDLLQVSSAGVVTAKPGDEVNARELLGGSDIPAPDAGKYPMAAVKLYDGQVKITADVNSSLDDIIDLRWGGYAVAGGAGFDVGDAIHDATAGTLSDEDEFPFWENVADGLRKITWANVKATLTTYFDTLYAALIHTHHYRQFVWVDDGSGGWEFVTADGEPVLNLEETE